MLIDYHIKTAFPVYGYVMFGMLLVDVCNHLRKKKSDESNIRVEKLKQYALWHGRIVMEWNG